MMSLSDPAMTAIRSLSWCYDALQSNRVLNMKMYMLTSTCKKVFCISISITVASLPLPLPPHRRLFSSLPIVRITR